MATSSFDKRFILSNENEVKRFYESLNALKKVKKINTSLTSLEKEREAEKKLRLLFSR